MALGSELKQVRRRSGGRVHLVVDPAGDTQALCGVALKGGDYEMTERTVDCRNCLRRKDDPTRLSSAFFASDMGGRLLELSLEQARQRPRRRAGDAAEADSPTPARPRLRIQPDPDPGPEPEPEPEVFGELITAGFRHFAPDTFTSPAGVVVRLSGDRVAEVTFDGRFQMLRPDASTAVLRIGDVELACSAADGRLLGVCRRTS